MASCRWASDKVSNNNPTHGFEDQILYCSERRKYCLMTKSQSILLSCWITLCTTETWNFSSVHAHRCLIFDSIEHFGICVTPECIHVSQSGAVPSVSAWVFGVLDMLSAQLLDQKLGSSLERRERKILSCSPFLSTVDILCSI